MTEEWVSYVLYGVRLPEQDGWIMAYLQSSDDQAEAHLAARYPNALESRIVNQGMCKRDSFAESLSDMGGQWLLLELDWHFDPEKGIWRAPGEIAPVPETPAVPAMLRVSTDPPRDGRWPLRFAFFPRSEKPERKRWQEAYPNQERIHLSARCSEVADPLHRVDAFRVKTATRENARITIDEEGRFVQLSVWHLPDDQAYIRIESLHDGKSDRHDFYVNSSDLAAGLNDAYNDFLNHGGWGESVWALNGDDGGALSGAPV